MSDAPRKFQVKIDGKAGEVVRVRHGFGTAHVVVSTFDAEGVPLLLMPDVNDVDTVTVVFNRDVQGALIVVVA